MADDPDFEVGGHTFELVMPFVVCASEGGPYDDQALTAGFTLGIWYERLKTVNPGWGRINVWESIRTDLIPQFDLMAMKFGWRMLHTPVEGMPEWSNVAFERTGD